MKKLDLDSKIILILLAVFLSSLFYKLFCENTP